MDKIYEFFLAHGPLGIIVGIVLYVVISLVSSPWISKLITPLVAWHSKKAKNKFVSSLNNIFDMYTVIDDIYELPEVDCVMMVKGSNGGAVPKPGSDFYVRVINEKHKLNINISQEKFSGIKVDTHHIETLIKLSTNSVLKFVVSEMPDCLLKRIWTSEGFTYKELHFIHATDTEMYYISIGTISELQKFSDQSNLHIELSINSLRQLFNKFSK